MERGPGCVVAIYGPTGSGKTAVAVEVAARLGVRVVSADSMQIYRGFPVLTNQPAPGEAALAPHALVAVADPQEEWNAARYAAAAHTRIDEDVEERGWAVIAGGTGLYLRAALAPLQIPEVHDPVLRARLEARAEREGGPALYAELGRRDPGAAERIDPRNVRRVIRALEVCLVEGDGAWSGRADLWRPAYRHPTLLVGLTMPRAELYERINRRAEAMVRGGAVEEVRRFLAERGWDAEGGITQAMGFGQIRALLEGELDEEETIERLAAAHRRYVRAQLTWLRRLEDVVMMDASAAPANELAEEIIELARARCGAGGIPDD